MVTFHGAKANLVPLYLCRAVTPSGREGKSHPNSLVIPPHPSRVSSFLAGISGRKVTPKGLRYFIGWALVWFWRYPVTYDDRGWDGWMASLTGWTWVGVNSGSWWWTGRPGVLQFTGSQRVDMTEWRNWTELNWTEYIKLSWVFNKNQGCFNFQKLSNIIIHHWIKKNIHMIILIDV